MEVKTCLVPTLILLCPLYNGVKALKGLTDLLAKDLTREPCLLIQYNLSRTGMEVEYKEFCTMNIIWLIGTILVVLGPSVQI